MKVSAIFIVIAVLSTAFFVVHNSHYVMDDVFIGFRYASNIASGHGIVWNIGELPLEGYSNFGWIIIMAAFSFMDLVIAAKLIGLICLVAVGFVYYKISKDYPDLPDWKYVFAVALLFLLVGPAAAFHSTSGIGTILIGLFFLLLIYSAYIVYEYKKPMKWFFVIALIISLLRPEGMLPSIALTIFLMWKNRNIRLPVSKEKKSNKTISWSLINLKYLLIYIIPLWMYFIWKLWYFGDILPMPFYFKVMSSTMFRGLPTLFRNLGYLSPFLVIILLARNRIKNFLTVTLIGSGAYISIYLVASRLSQNVLQRFYFPVFVVIYILAAIALGTFNINRYYKYAVLLIPLILVTTNVYFMDDYVNENNYVNYMLERIEIAKSMNPKLTIVYPNAGVFSYYSECRFIDSGGLNDKFMAQKGIITVEYLEQIKPDVLIYLVHDTDYIKEIEGDWKAKPLWDYGIKYNFVLLNVSHIHKNEYVAFYGKSEDIDLFTRPPLGG